MIDKTKEGAVTISYYLTRKKVIKMATQRPKWYIVENIDQVKPRLRLRDAQNISSFIDWNVPCIKKDNIMTDGVNSIYYKVEEISDYRKYWKVSPLSIVSPLESKPVF